MTLKSTLAESERQLTARIVWVAPASLYVASMILSLVASCKGLAQSAAYNGAIQGAVVVMDSRGTSYVSGAKVVLQGRKTSQTETDENGRCSFRGIEPGKYTLAASFPGLQAAQEITVQRDTDTKVELELKPVPVTSSVTVDGTSSYDKVPTITEKITEKTIVDAPNVNDQLQNLLPMIPGVVRGPDGRINMKGARNTQSGALVNSANVTDPATGSTAVSQQILAPEPQTGAIIGTVTDGNDGTVPGATVALEGPSLADSQRVETSDNGFFQLDHLNPEMPYHITVSASGFADWNSPEVILQPGQHMDLTGIRLRIAAAVTTVNAVLSTEELAWEQEKAEEKQRVLGFIPNFYAVYDRNAVPLTPKLKFRLALKTTTDPITFLGSAFLADLDQANNNHNYGQGGKAYGQRLGAHYANGLTDIMIGGAILPTILHQDPRYFYQGTGTKKSRMLHALSTPFICRGDNGRWQPNYSGLGGYLASGAISNAYYPSSDRGPGLTFSTTFIDIAADMANGLIQEFVLRKLTPSAKGRPQLEAGGN